MATTPIKRNKNFIPLSKDHHHGLLLCWKIREGLKNGIELERIKNYINFFWQKHLMDHFGQEETLLFSKVDSPLVSQANEEHASIRLLISEINKIEDLNKESYSQLADLVEKHIRFEERVLFPFLEEKIPFEEMEIIGAALEAQHTQEYNYEDEFWIRKVVKE